MLNVVPDPDWSEEMLLLYACPYTCTHTCSLRVQCLCTLVLYQYLPVRSVFRYAHIQLLHTQKLPRRNKTNRLWPWSNNYGIGTVTLLKSNYK